MKSALLYVGLFVCGALIAGLVGLYMALPDANIPCGDECGGRALATAFRAALGGAFFFMFIGIGCMRRQRRNRR